jgi:gliding motility-associated-like protein
MSKNPIVFASGLTCLMLLLFSECISQKISTIAGNGQFAVSADSIPAINAPINYMTSLGTDTSGFIYLNDGYSNTIRKINPLTGIVNTIAGNRTRGFSGDGGLATLASMNNPCSFVIDKQGNIFVCDKYNNRVRKIDAATHIIETIAGNGTKTYSDNSHATQTGFPSQPSSIDIDNQGNLYIGANEFESYGGQSYIFKIDAVTRVIKKIAGNGTNIYSGSGMPALQTGFYITGIRVDLAGDIFFADPIHNCILKISTLAGIITTVAGSGTINGYAYRGDGGLAVNALLNAPSDICFDLDANLLIADLGNEVIRKVDKITGIITTVAGNGIVGYSGDGGIAGCARLHIPNGSGVSQSGITTDQFHNLYFCDQANTRIRKVDQNPVQVQTPGFFISTASIHPCPGEKVSVKGSVTSNVTLAQDQIVCQSVKNGLVVGGDSLVYITDSLENSDTVYCVLKTQNNICQPVLVKSNILVFKIQSGATPSVEVAPSDTAVCPNQSISFKATIFNANKVNAIYQWQINGINTGLNNSSYIIPNPRNGDNISCFVSTTTQNCPVVIKIFSNVIPVKIKKAPQVSLSPTDTTIRAGSTIQLNATLLANTSSFSWQPLDNLVNASTLHPLASPTKTTQYHFRASSKDNCTIDQTLVVRISLPFYMPSAFTPNHDGKNDFFRIPPGANIDLTEFTIYNRWGEKIFFTRNPAVGWDGNFKGMEQPQGVYIYIIKGNIEGQPILSNGTTILLR